MSQVTLSPTVTNTEHPVRLYVLYNSNDTYNKWVWSKYNFCITVLYLSVHWSAILYRKLTVFGI